MPPATAPPATSPKPPTCVANCRRENVWSAGFTPPNFSRFFC